MIDRERAIDTFTDLVMIDSPSGDEAQVREHLLAKLDELGLRCEVDKTGNIVARLAAKRGAALLLGVHMDTVEPGRGIKPIVDGDVIRSDGTTILGGDDKAGVAAVLELLTVLRENELPHPPIEVVVTVGEEQALYGARHLNTSRLASESGIVLDSGGPPGRIVVEAPSKDLLDFTIHGRAAHAGHRPEEGVNAIRVASEAIAAMPMGRIDDETTCNIGLISGGTGRNSVPDEAVAVGEARSRDTDKLDQLTGSIVAEFEAAADRHGATADLEVTHAYRAYRLSADERIVRVLADTAKSLGIEPELVATGGGSDANIFNAAGIPCTNLSNGTYRVHTTDEHLVIDHWVDSMRILLSAIVRMTPRA
ncbi:MAG: M20/M25/M40 family metallo-hydrolase [Anaerolineae bacterium]